METERIKNNGSLEDTGKRADVEDLINSDYADILLIQCPPWDIAMPPLGIVYLSGYLRK